MMIIWFLLVDLVSTKAFQTGLKIDSALFFLLPVTFPNCPEVELTTIHT